jgi:hypothetical protein
MKSITIDGCEVWIIKEENKKNTGFGSRLLVQISKDI